MQRITRLAVPALALALLSACVTRTQTINAPNAPVYSPPQTNAPVYSPSRSTMQAPAMAYGVVRSIESVGTAGEQPQGAGAVVGGVIGAVIGRQMADSSAGKNVGTVAGAVGGALIGNEVEKNARRDQQALRVHVQIDRGGVRSFDFKSIGDLRVGDRVRIEGNQLYRL